MKKDKFLKLFILIMLLFSCEKNTIIETCENTSKKNGQSNICSPKIMSYHFGVELLSTSEQIEKLSNLGMDGMIVQIETNNLQQLDSYYENCLVKNEVFNIYNIFTTVSINKPKDYKQQLTTIETIYKKIENKNTQLQVLFSGEKNNEILKKTIAKIAVIAKKYNKSLIIYPHYELAIETAEEALFFIEDSNEKNIFLSVHLCHELAAGNGNRIESVVKNVSPFIKSISISGASLSEKLNEDLPLWFWGIKPLSMGTYDYSKFTKALFINNYKGPIAIHTWGIFNNFNLPVEEHLPESKSIINTISKNLCKKLP